MNDPTSHGPGHQGPINWQDLFTQAQENKGNAHADFTHLRNRFSQMGKKALIVLIVLVVLALAFCYWWFHPPINIHSVDLWFFLTLFVLAPLFLVFAAFRFIYKNGSEKREKSPKKEKLFKGLMLIPVIIALVGVVGALASQTFFPGNAEKYATILETTDSSFEEDIQEVNYSEIPFIDRDSAILLGNRTMGAMADYVSQYEISELYSQINYHNEPVRVSPLNHADLFKWFQNRDTGIPAYVIVNMSTQDTEVVRLDTPIYYSDSEPLERNIDRYTQLKYPFYMFDEKSFEIDEDGNPYWVFPVQDRTIGLFGGTTISRVVLVNACTGETQDLAIEDVPQWVDRAYPAELLIQQYNWSGSLMDGWINSWLGQNGVKQTTPGTNGQLGYNYVVKDDDIWVYSGVTSATADNSIIGFVLINQRTAESHFYTVAGATEDSAMSSAEGQVQQMQYQATFPLLINVGGQPTYFMALKDNAGLVKMYAMIDIQRYQNVAVGNTIEECEESYKTLLRNNGIEVKSGDGEDTVQTDGSITGTIEALNPVVIDGNTHYYVLISGSDRIYDCPIASFADIVRYHEGDTVTIAFTPSESALVAVQSITRDDATNNANNTGNATNPQQSGDQAVVAQGTEQAA